MKLTLSADELVELVVKHGYERAAKQAGCSTSGLWRAINSAGRTDEVKGRRDRLRRKAITDAAQTLGVSKSAVKKLRANGTLPKAFTDADVAALFGKWALVVQSKLPPNVRQCKVCGAYFRIKDSWVRQGRGTTCSIKCRDTLRWGERRVEKPKPPKTVAVRIFKRPVRRIFFVDSTGACASAGRYKPAKIYGDRDCVECGARFSPAQTNRKKYCSSRCAKRAGRQARKARKRGAVKIERVYRRKVYERDKWRCHICGRKIDKHLQAPNPAAATLDHIHPLSLGGSHTYDNVKAAHYGCNSARGNRDEFQMRMPVAA